MTMSGVKSKADPRERRVDAMDKIAGQTRYIRDMAMPGMWYGATVRCPHPRARILSIEFKPEFDWTAVAVVTARDVPVNYVAMPENDMPFLADKIANYAGEPVALIAAPTRDLAERAREFVAVEYEPLPALFDMLKSEKSDVRIFKESNVFKEILIEKGDLNKARREAAATIELESSTGYQEHLYLEPQGVIAVPEGERIVIRGSMQCPFYIRRALATLFDGEKRVTVIQAPTGGAFGGKEDFPSLLAGHAALLANKCGHPVAMFYEREEDVQFTTKRHPSNHRDKAYVARDGRLLGLHLEFHFGGGAYCTLSPVVLARGALAACGTYHVPHARVHAKAVATNTVPSGAFRGFGGPQTVFAVEMLMEKIALDLKLSPVRVRELNLISEGQTTATEQVLRYSVSARETFQDVIARSDYHRKYAEFGRLNTPILDRLRHGEFPKARSSEVLRGIGISSWLHGAGFTGTGENRISGTVRVGLSVDGRPVIYAASTEMGQGKQTVFQIILGDALGIEASEIIVAEPNTDLVPDSGPTVASRTTMIVGSLLVDAAKELIERLKQRLYESGEGDCRYEHGFFRLKKGNLAFADAARRFPDITVEKQYHHPPFIQFDDVHYKGDAYPVFAWAAAAAELEVDPVTFETRVTRYTTTQDVGKAINPDQVIAQIEGGTLQGIGYALYEKVQLQNGRFDVTGFTDYIIPTVTEMPVFDVKIWENPYPYGPFGAKGLGELPFVGAAPAVVSALWMIFERPFTKIPVLPEDLARLFMNRENAKPC
jgi:CO/xanthine dehydrogenase Mo-binding subunit